jgi:hypothetical protein
VCCEQIFICESSVGVMLYLLLWVILLVGLLWLRDSASVHVMLSVCLEVPRFVALFSFSTQGPVHMLVIENEHSFAP